MADVFNLDELRQHIEEERQRKTEYKEKRSKQATAAHRVWITKLSPEAFEERRGRSRTWERANRKRITGLKHQQRLEKKTKLVELMGSKCFDCDGTFHPRVFDFHHTDPSNKTNIIAVMYQHKWETVLKEIEGCVLLCANCHRMRHVNE